MSDRLNGKVCLITGGGRGLGKAMALAFANEGAKAVAITYNSNEKYAEETCQLIAESGSTAYMTPVEVTNRESIKAWVVSQEVLPFMVENNGGRIINIASVSGLYGGPTTAHYAASKAGLISLTQVLARWGAEHGILVNSISPGIIETDLTREELRSGGGAGVVALTLLKRPGQVDDVSSIAVMLASDEQNYMTGQTISPNGGSYFTD